MAGRSCPILSAIKVSGRLADDTEKEEIYTYDAMSEMCALTLRELSRVSQLRKLPHLLGVLRMSHLATDEVRQEIAPTRWSTNGP